jgi:protein-L-isoaspartate(D-aspartate) O-methyltransferase
MYNCHLFFVNCQLSIVPEAKNKNTIKVANRQLKNDYLGMKRQNKDEYDLARQRMLRYDLQGRGITSSQVLTVMAEVPREEFIPADQKFQAYGDCPLPIGAGQTISQPYIVALMSQELRITPDCEVLEIGTGSGYQTAVLSRLAKKVYTIERLAELSKSAQTVLTRLGYNNIEFYIGDGSLGWPESRLPPAGYFDRIIVTAAVPKMPESLIHRLAEGGFLIAPVGYSDVQELILCEKRAGKTIQSTICDVRFVKLFGQYGFGQ